MTKKQPRKLILNKNTLANLDKSSMASLFGKNQDGSDTVKNHTTTTTTTIMSDLSQALDKISGLFCPLPTQD